MPRWVPWVLGIIAGIWALSDPTGFAAFIKHGMDSIITLFKNLIA